MTNPLSTEAAQLQVDVLGEACKEYLLAEYDMPEAMSILIPLAAALDDAKNRLEGAAFCIYLAMKQLELHREQR